MSRDDLEKKVKVIDSTIEGLKAEFRRNALEINSCTINEQVPEILNELIREAYWCYVFSRYASSLLLSVLVVERALFQGISARIGDTKARHVKLFALIELAVAYGIITKELGDIAHRLRKRRDSYIHADLVRGVREPGHSGDLEAPSFPSFETKEGSLEAYGDMCKIINHIY
ncbi:MAG: hypothetical protein ACE5PM_06850, partial [Candidatus Hydrothermarchaeales archaeon]